MRHGLKKWITRYRSHRYQCQSCGAVSPPEQKPWTRGKFGFEIIAYALYLNVELRLPQMHVDQSLNRLFGFDLTVGRTTHSIKEQAAMTYRGVYDAIQCPQQKCLIHLIRDLNDDPLKNPYDKELKQLALAFAVLLKPMVETIDRYGLKSRFLRKHLAAVDRFCRQISDMTPHSEIAVKLKERLEKNRDKLFTFLSFDGVPWNNNNAEHAVKPFAALRHIIGGVTSEKGIRDYLVLLSLCETCKYMGVDFLDFLRLGEKDIHALAESRNGRRRRSTSSEPQAPPGDETADK